MWRRKLMRQFNDMISSIPNYTDSICFILAKRQLHTYFTSIKSPLNKLGTKVKNGSLEFLQTFPSQIESIASFTYLCILALKYINAIKWANNWFTNLCDSDEYLGHSTWMNAAAKKTNLKQGCMNLSFVKDSHQCQVRLKENLVVRGIAYQKRSLYFKF